MQLYKRPLWKPQATWSLLAISSTGGALAL